MSRKNSKQPILRSWKLVEGFRRLLAENLRQEPAETIDSKRKLATSEYFSLVLFGMFNPVVRTTRGLCRASRLSKVQKLVSGRRVSLGSFSEAQHSFDPKVLLRVLQNCASQAERSFGRSDLWQAIQELTAHDSTLIRALPRMAWAVWMDKANRGVRVHVDFEVFKQVPGEVAIEPAGRCERKVWKPWLRKNRFYVADRYFGHDYGLLRLIRRRGSHFVFRLHNNAHLEPVENSERVLQPEDRTAGVVLDQLVWVGRKEPRQQFRLVRVEVGEHRLDLLTSDLEMSAELIALIYRYRWQVELYFKWLKCILGCEHWLAESPQGVAIQVYCALIASVMLALWSGRRPTKRAMEALQFYQLGWASRRDLKELLQLEKMW